MAIYTKPLNEVWQDEPPASQHDSGTPSDAEHNIDFIYGESATERRNRIAEGFAFALTGSGVNYRSAHHMVREAIEAADILIAELDKP